MFDQAQIQEFKEVRGEGDRGAGHGEFRTVLRGFSGVVFLLSMESAPGCVSAGVSIPPWQAFNMIDQNRDGFIDHEDLKDMLASLGESACRHMPSQLPSLHPTCPHRSRAQ